LTDFGKSPAGFSPNNEAVPKTEALEQHLFGTASIDKKIMICIALHTFYIYKEIDMKKVGLFFLLCCAVMAFAASCVTSRFSGVIEEVSLDTDSEGVLGYFDVEVKVPRHPSGSSVRPHDPEIIDAIKLEISKQGGTRAVDVMIDGQERIVGNTTVRVRGTVVK
jgi:hypothetical protein